MYFLISLSVCDPHDVHSIISDNCLNLSSSYDSNKDLATSQQLELSFGEHYSARNIVPRKKVLQKITPRKKVLQKIIPRKKVPRNIFGRRIFLKIWPRKNLPRNNSAEETSAEEYSPELSCGRNSAEYSVGPMHLTPRRHNKWTY